MPTSIKKIAEECGFEPKLVSDVLKEVPGVAVPKSTADKIFSTARRLGYDLKKLKLGKRMQVRKETLEEVLQKISDNTHWSRTDVIKYLHAALGLVERVHKRVYPEEFGG